MSHQVALSWSSLPRSSATTVASTLATHTSRGGWPTVVSDPPHMVPRSGIYTFALEVSRVANVGCGLFGFGGKAWCAGYVDKEQGLGRRAGPSIGFDCSGEAKYASTVIGHPAHSVGVFTDHAPFVVILAVDTSLCTVQFVLDQGGFSCTSSVPFAECGFSDDNIGEMRLAANFYDNGMGSAVTIISYTVPQLKEKQQEREKEAREQEEEEGKRTDEEDDEMMQQQQQQQHRSNQHRVNSSTPEVDRVYRSSSKSSAAKQSSIPASSNRITPATATSVHQQRNGNGDRHDHLSDDSAPSSTTSSFTPSFAADYSLPSNSLSPSSASSASSLSSPHSTPSSFSFLSQHAPLLPPSLLTSVSSGAMFTKYCSFVHRAALPVRIAVIGAMGQGKSSFITLCLSALQEDEQREDSICRRAHVAASDTAVTRRITEYRLPHSSSPTRGVTLVDTWGYSLSDSNPNWTEFGSLLKGDLKHGYQMGSSLNPSENDKVRKATQYADRMHAVIFVVSAQEAEADHSGAYASRMKYFTNTCNQIGVRYLIVTTKVDELILSPHASIATSASASAHLSSAPVVDDDSAAGDNSTPRGDDMFDVRAMFTNSNVIAAVNRIAKKTGVPAGQIFPVKCYCSESVRSRRLESAAMRALAESVRLAVECYDEEERGILTTSYMVDTPHRQQQQYQQQQQQYQQQQLQPQQPQYHRSAAVGPNHSHHPVSTKQPRRAALPAVRTGVTSSVQSKGPVPRQS